MNAEPEEEDFSPKIGGDKMTPLERMARAHIETVGAVWENLHPGNQKREVECMRAAVAALLDMEPTAGMIKAWIGVEFDERTDDVMECKAYFSAVLRALLEQQP